MPNNYRVLVQTGSGLYVGKAAYIPGASQQGTADNPRTLASVCQEGAPYDITIGGGVYRDFGAAGFGGGGRGVVLATFRADGQVKILGDGKTLFSPLVVANTFFYDISFEQFAGYNLHDGDSNSAPTGFVRCILKCTPETASNYNSKIMGNTIFTDCIIYNLNLTGYDNIRYPLYATFNNCIFINCTIEDSTAVNRCYIDPNSSIRTRSATANNIDPGCNTDLNKGLNIVASVNADSTPNYSAAWNASNPQGLRALPSFNSVAKEDFTLRIESAHLGTRNIGPSHLRYSNSFYAEFSGGSGDAAALGNLRFRATGTNYVTPLADITSGSQSFDVNTQGGLIIRPSSNSDYTATLITGLVPHSAQNEEIAMMLLKAGLNFNTEFPATEGAFNPSQPEIYNNNVPDFSNGAPGSAARNPNRLTYRMRWSTKLNPSADLGNAEDWITGTQFLEFEWNSKPQWIPASNIGNGDAAFNASGAESVICRYYQLQVRLRNNYYK